MCQLRQNLCKKQLLLKLLNLLESREITFQDSLHKTVIKIRIKAKIKVKDKV